MGGEMSGRDRKRVKKNLDLKRFGEKVVLEGF